MVYDLQSVLDEIMMSAQYVVEMVDDVMKHTKETIKKFKDSPKAAIRDLAKGSRKYNLKLEYELGVVLIVFSLWCI